MGKETVARKNPKDSSLEELLISLDQTIEAFDCGVRYYVGGREELMELRNHPQPVEGDSFVMLHEIQQRIPQIEQHELPKLITRLGDIVLKRQTPGYVAQEMLKIGIVIGRRQK